MSIAFGRYRRRRSALRHLLHILTTSFVLAGIGDSNADIPKSRTLAELTWTDPMQAASDDPDFLLQGEYGAEKGATEWGMQVVALGGGEFDGYLLKGGLPGAGWKRGQRRITLHGNRHDRELKLVSDNQTIKAIARRRMIHVFREDELIAELPRIERKSTTLGAKPPKGAVVLFDGTSSDAWINGSIENGLLRNNDVTTKQTFDDYTLHLEFRTPYKPYARGQQRGNSGIYQQGRYETQVLDSFGLEGRMNETGGIYSIAAPSVNACLPPLAWQTYDIDFRAARFDQMGKLSEPARITVRLNGILVQGNQPLPHTTTAAPIKTISAEPGPIYIQHHCNPVYYRNIWIVRK